MKRFAWLVLQIVLSLLCLKPEKLYSFNLDLGFHAGKRWLEISNHNYSTIESFILSGHGHVWSSDQLNLYLGPSLVLDHYEQAESCERQSCFSVSHYKSGVDAGLEFLFPSITLFLQGRVLVYSWGRQKLWGKSQLIVAQGLGFENAKCDGELIYRTKGVDITSGLKWRIAEKWSLMASLEIAIEKHRIEKAQVKLRNERGDLMYKSSSLQTSWSNYHSSGVYLGVAYSI